MLKRLFTALLLAGLVHFPAAAQTNVPGAEWARTSPAMAGWDPALIDEAQSYSRMIGTASFMIVQHGVVVASWGDITDRLELHSVRKSLLSALIGIAVSEKKIDLNASLRQLGIDDIPPLTDAEKQATVQQLLEARSGVYHPALYETPGEKRRRPERGSHPPGTFWYYNNWDFNALGDIYEHAEQQSIFAAFQTRIAGPIGMQDYRPSDGRYVTGADSVHPAYPFHMSARDLARFGLLYLHHGVWQDSAGRDLRVVPAAWVHDSTQPISRTYLNTGYGYLWWTAFASDWAEVMDMPPGGFWADGAKGQFVAVDPASDLVVVHQTNGASVTNKQFGHLMWLILRAAHAPDPGHDP